MPKRTELGQRVVSVYCIYRFGLTVFICIPIMVNTMRVTSLGRELKRLRVEHGFTVRELSTCLGKSPGYVGQIETQGEVPTPDLIRKIAEVLREEPEAHFRDFSDQVRRGHFALSFNLPDVAWTFTETRAELTHGKAVLDPQPLKLSA